MGAGMNIQRTSLDLLRICHRGTERAEHGAGRSGHDVILPATEHTIESVG